jgi:enoyl-CoA hydratase
VTSIVNTIEFDADIECVFGRIRPSRKGASVNTASDRLITYELNNGVATIVMDDGKVNALSQRMFDQLNAAFDRADTDRAIVVLTGRPGVFSAGFDLPVLRAGGAPAETLILSGFKLAQRMLSFSTPVVVACTGHALAMGVFLVLAADYRIGAAGAFKIGANEVAIGLTVPNFAIEMCRQRLQPAHFNRAVINAEIFAPEDALVAGFIDKVVAPDQLRDAASNAARQLGTLHMPSHSATKLRARDRTLKSLRVALEDDTSLMRARGLT